MKNIIKKILPKKILLILIAIRNYFLYFIHIFLGKQKKYFNFNGKKHKYFSAAYNTTFNNERAIEIPIILNYLENFKNNKILEIGNVISHYKKTSYDIVDKYEKQKGIINSDIIEYNPQKKYDLIISISTFEHIGFDEKIRYGTKKDITIQQKSLLKAIEHTKTLLNQDGMFIFTVPLGFNQFLDSQLAENKLGLTKMHFFKRISTNNERIETKYEDIKNIKYNNPYTCANGLLIGMYKAN